MTPADQSSVSRSTPFQRRVIQLVVSELLSRNDELKGTLDGLAVGRGAENGLSFRQDPRIEQEPLSDQVVSGGVAAEPSASTR